MQHTGQIQHVWRTFVSSRTTPRPRSEARGGTHRVWKGKLLRQQQRDPSERVELRVYLRARVPPRLSREGWRHTSCTERAGFQPLSEATQSASSDWILLTLKLHVHRVPRSFKGECKILQPDPSHSHAGAACMTAEEHEGRQMSIAMPGWQAAQHKSSTSTPCSSLPNAPTVARPRAAAARSAATASPGCPPRCCPARQVTSG